ncbi:MAG: hypothetical protein AAGA54_31655 [Myxococcota bacterium]
MRGGIEIAGVVIASGAVVGCSTESAEAAEDTERGSTSAAGDDPGDATGAEATSPASTTTTTTTTASSTTTDGVDASSSTGAFDGPDDCAEAAPFWLRTCFAEVAAQTRACFVDAGAPCEDFASATEMVRDGVEAACANEEVQSLGFGERMTTASLGDRLAEACVGHAQTLAARIFGGPHGAVLAANAGQPTEGCLDAAFAANAAYLEGAFEAQSACVLDDACDPESVTSALIELTVAEANTIDAACPADLLQTLVGQRATEVLGLARLQSQCMTADAHGDTEPLSLLCGPGAMPGVTPVRTQPEGLEPLAPGVPTLLQLDGAVWGTRCGDGSPYHFWIEMPPEGASADRVHAFVQGGGACFGVDCFAQDEERFRSDDDDYQSEGVLNAGGTESAAEVDPFTDWVKANFEYCTQDFHVGVGVTQSVPGGLTVERYGGNNLRAGLMVLRNLVAQRRNAEAEAGYRPDALRVFFTGNSAGALGVGFHLHHLIDDLRWIHTTTGAAAGTSVNDGLAGIIGPALEEWDVRRVMPPYCQSQSCYIPGDGLYQAHAERLLGTPSQRLLVVHNQVDDTQSESQLIFDTAAHINALRETYCDTQGLPGVHWFLSARPQSAHSVFSDDPLYRTLTAGGVTMDTWTAGAVLDPAATVDQVDEGTLQAAIGGVQPFPCALR